jgi:hypothetical protein
VRYDKLPGHGGLTLKPHRPVETSAADFFAGSDPVLAAAIALP